MKDLFRQIIKFLFFSKPGQGLIVFGGLLILYNYVDYGCLKVLTAAQTLFVRHGAWETGFYLGTYILAIAAVEAAFFSRSCLVRYASFIIAGVALMAQLICRKCYGSDLGVEEVQLCWRERAVAGQAVATFGTSMLQAIIETAIVIFTLSVVAHCVRLKIRQRWLALIPSAGMMIFLVVWWTGGGANEAYPSILKVPVLGLRAFLTQDYDGPRDPVHLDGGSDFNKPRYILFIVDESVRGDMLSLNGWGADTTPFLKTNNSIVNLGVACAAANVSATANLVLRSGLRRDQIPDKQQLSLHMPSIFQYAKSAGYRTYYLDGQAPQGRFVNFMNQQERGAIDVFWQASAEATNLPASSIDRICLRQIKTILNSGESAFIYVNKYGCHFNYAIGYPPERAIFKPTMPAGVSFENIDRQTVINTYQNDIRWSVDDFLKELWADLDTDNTFLLYTSDHGQSIKEGKHLATHGDVDNPPKVQANVPLFLAGNAAKSAFALGMGEIRDKASAFQIFPSMLIAMGYSEAEVISKYGVPLWNRNPSPRAFLSGDIFGRDRTHLNMFDASIGVQP